MTSNGPGPISIPIRNGGPSCLSLSCLTFPSNVTFTHTERNDILIWFHWTACHPQGLSPGSGAAANPLKSPRFRSNLILVGTSSTRSMASSATNLGKGTFQEKRLIVVGNTHRHPTPAKCPQGRVKHFSQDYVQSS